MGGRRRREWNALPASCLPPGAFPALYRFKPDGKNGLFLIVSERQFMTRAAKLPFVRPHFSRIKL